MKDYLLSRNKLVEYANNSTVGIDANDIMRFPCEKVVEPCEDTISRQAVLSKIKEVCFSEEWLQFRVDNGSNGQRDVLINYIEQLAPVTPTHKKGKWIIDSSIGCKCSEYGRKPYPYQTDSSGDDCWKPDYCPNCGKEMEGEE